LWYLKQKGVAIANSRLQIADDKLGMADGVRGEIDYPKLKQKVEVVLTPEKEAELLEIVQRAEQVMSQEHPPERINKKFCKTCSYFELCWVNQ
jgi:CRISPR-associated exonuclease Cas4